MSQLFVNRVVRGVKSLIKNICFPTALEAKNYLQLRNEEYRKKLKKIGRPVRIFEPVVLTPLGKISIGSNVVIHQNAYFWAEGGITIGDNVAIARGCTIMTSNHNYDGDLLPWSEESICKPVFIEDNVWVGLNVIILPGVIIREGAIIGAGSVVTHEIPKGTVAAGNPARAIKMRDLLHYEELKVNKKFRLIPTDIEVDYLVSK